MTILEQDGAKPDLVKYPILHEPGRPFDMPEPLREIADSEEFAQVELWDGLPAWLVTRYEPVRTLLGDERLSSDVLRENFPTADPTAQLRFRHQPMFLNMDEPVHGWLRRMVQPYFAFKRINAMREPVQAICDELIDDFLQGPNPGELLHDFALPLPSRVFGELLGVPWEDHEYFTRTNDTMISTKADPKDVVEAIDSVSAYLAALIERRIDDPADDVLSHLAQNYVKTGEITVAQAANTGMLLLNGGYETTANSITLSVIALLEHPDQLALLRANADDPVFVAGAVEELLRWISPLQWGRRRMALADIEIDGVLIKEGDRIVTDTTMANRDPSIFDDPDRLDLTRNASRHVSFGFGVHQCIGQPLARVEMQVALSTLFTRIPTLELAVPVAELPYKNDMIYGVYELPVRW